MREPTSSEGVSPCPSFSQNGVAAGSDIGVSWKIRALRICTPHGWVDAVQPTDPLSREGRRGGQLLRHGAGVLRHFLAGQDVSRAGRRR